MRWNNLPIEKKISLTVAVGFSLAAAFVAIYFLHNQESQMNQLLLKQARIMFTQIQTTRHWNAEHGGVYVFLKEGEHANPYLYKVGRETAGAIDFKPEIRDENGQRLALINPALMTRQLAKETEQHSNIRFHLTSLKLINPHNEPDAFERASLQLFEQSSVRERTAQAEIGGKPYFRYMAPLLIEKPCLKCHGFQGYHVGDIRGGISVSIPMAEELAIVHENRIDTLAFGVLILVSILAVLIFAIRRVIGQPLRELTEAAGHIGADGFSLSGIGDRGDEFGGLWRMMVASDKALRTQWQELEDVAKDMEQKSLTDSLTQAHNRHHLYIEAPKLLESARQTRKPLCIAMIDLDHFKQINDHYGHQTGDEALRMVAELIRPSVRPDDLFIRYGGEEFLLVLPETPLEEGERIAESVRHRVETAQIVPSNGRVIPLRVSIGIDCIVDATLDQAIIHADEALYAAKANGRNQIAVFDLDNRAHTFVEAPPPN